MGKILISDLHPIRSETFLHDINPVQAEAILGGGYPYIYITNVTDSVKINSAGDDTIEGANSDNNRDNKVNTTDYSRSNYIRIFT